MRFFDHQASARSRSLRLTLAFWFIVLLTVAAVHVAVVGFWLLMSLMQPSIRDNLTLGVHLALVAVVLLMIFGGWWLETHALAEGSSEFARKLGARDLQPDKSFAEQRLNNIVAEMALSAQMRMPNIMLMPRVENINAFALGTSPKDWCIVVTQGALSHLTRRELQGLVAHECSHLKEGDTLLNMRLLGMVGGLGMVHGYGEWVEEHAYAPQFRFLGTLVKLTGFTGWIGGRLLQAATSREREFLADARAVQWTRDVDGLGGVLRKVMTQQVKQTVSQSNSLTASVLGGQALTHMLLVEWDENSTHWTERLASHPTLNERVSRLYGDHKDRLPLLPIDERSGEVRTNSPATGS